MRGENRRAKKPEPEKNMTTENVYSLCAKLDCLVAASRHSNEAIASAKGPRILKKWQREHLLRKTALWNTLGHMASALTVGPFSQDELTPEARAHADSVYTDACRAFWAIYG